MNECIEKLAKSHLWLLSLASLSLNVLPWSVGPLLNVVYDWDNSSTLLNASTLFTRWRHQCGLYPLPLVISRHQWGNPHSPPSMMT